MILGSMRIARKQSRKRRLSNSSRNRQVLLTFCFQMLDMIFFESLVFLEFGDLVSDMMLDICIDAGFLSLSKLVDIG